MQTKEVIGIDMAKDSFAVALLISGKAGYQHLNFNNTAAGVKKLCTHLSAASHCVMEASGGYYLPLAVYLHQAGMQVSVVNPLTIKRFAQMRLLRAKTDKKDAAIIAEYSKVEKPPLWQPRPAHMLQMQQLQALQDNLTSQLTRLKNQQQTFQCSGVENKFAHHLLVLEIDYVQKQIALLQQELVRLTQTCHQDLFARLQTIKGIGKQTAMTLILITEGFTRFDNSKQLCAYVGLSPRIFESGTSVKGKAKICKMGMSRMRKLLYLCAMRARSCNKACQLMFERLKERGKNGKLALIAIANKLLRQAFAIGKTQMSYQEF